MTDTPARLDHLFARQVERTPSAPALTAEACPLSYAELAERAGRLARLLAERGAGPERYVSVVLPRSADLVVALLAILQTGAAYVPIEPDHPPERVGWLLGDAAPVATITVTDIRLRLATEGIDAEWLVLDEPGTVQALKQAEPLPVDPARSPDHPAYVIYTSGSTGLPKGVVVTHRNVVRLFTAVGRRLKLRADDVWPLFHSCAFDVSVWEMWGALLHGGRLVVVPRSVTRSPEEFLRLLARERVTILNQTPSVFYQLLAAHREAPDVDAASALRYVIFAGEVLDLGRLADWYALHPESGPTLVNMYGITEITVHGSFLALDPESAASASGSLIGVPLPDLRFHVLDHDLRPVESGRVGELYVAGPGLARNYAHRPDLTAQRFVACPGTAGQRMYRSGDLVRLLPDGSLEYLRRTDDQVKLRGFRVELGEVESALRQEAEVGQAAVVVLGEGDTRRLVAYVAPADRTVPLPAPARLRAAVSRRLPSYMVPAAVRVLDAFPLTVNGKLDRRALPPPTREDSVEEAVIAPRTSAEGALVEIWREVLGLDSVGITDDFFALGGDSLSATRVLGRARSALGVALPARALFEDRTVEALAARGGTPAVDQRPLPSVSGPAPLSSVQQRFWFAHEFDPAGVEYNVHAGFRLRGPIDQGALAAALRALAARHEPLRSTVAWDGVRATAAVLEESDDVLPLTVCDLVDAPGSYRSPGELDRVLHEEVGRPFDLRRGPVARAVLVRRETHDHVLVLGMHHIATDGWSLGIAAQELGSLYAAAVQGEPAVLPRLPIRYSDYAAWQQQEFANQWFRPQLAFWRERLAGAEPLRLPTDRPHSAARTTAGSTHRVTLDRGLTSGVRALAATSGATTFMVLVATCQVLLARHCDQEDIAVGTVVSGRDRPDFERLIGPFINTVILRSTVEGATPFAGLLGQVRETVLNAFAHQDLPFDRVIDDLGITRAAGRPPLAQVLVVMQNTPTTPMALPGVRAEPLPLPRVASVADLTFEFTERDGELDLTVGYSTDLFDHPTVERLAARLRMLLAAVTADATQAVADLPLLDPAERALVVSAWNAPAAGAADRPVPQQVADRAGEAPGAVAVRAGDRTLTYRELDERADRLGHHLRALGAGPTAPVVTCLSRDLHLPVGLLGVMRAGAPYVPLAADLPPERVRLVLSETRAPVVLADRSTAGPLAGLGARVLELNDRVVTPAAARPATPPATPPHPEDLAYIIYTSGSTGTPKGVMATHRGLADLCAWHVAAFGVTEADRASLVAGLGFDAAAWELWPYLCVGASIDIPDPETLQHPTALTQWLGAKGTTVCFLPTPMAEVVLDEPDLDQTRLRVLLTGGDVLRRRPGPDRPFRLVNNYGPTEATVVATSGEVAIDAVAENPPIGAPVPGTAALVLDARLAPVPVGVPGELHLAGPRLARGYLGRPDLTTAQFIAHPFGGPGERLYRTGDVVRWRPDGTLDYLGRADGQVKLRGFRIELGEIEAVLARCDGIAQAVVVLREEDGRAARLVAYIVANPSRVVEGTAELAHAVGEVLPEYMVPSAFVVLDRLPLTANGKVDRRALPAPGGGEREGSREPCTSVEIALARIWSEVLGVERIGADDNFFGLGGDSIQSLQVVAHARRSGLVFTSRDLFRWQTVAALAPHVRIESRADRDRGAAGEPEEAESAPLTPVQRMLVDDLGAPANFHHVVTVELDGLVDAAVLEAAVTALVEHHPALRFRVEVSGGRWSQRAMPLPAGPTLRMVDASALPTVMLDDAVARETSRAVSDTDPRSGPPFAAVLVAAGGGRPDRLVLVAHHLIVDGVSWRILLEDLRLAYAQACVGEPVDLGVPTTSFASWSRRLTELADAGGFDTEAAAWRLASSVDLPRLPVDLAGTNPSRAARQVRVHLDPATTRALLRDLPAAHLADTEDALLAALAPVLAAWSGDRRVMVAVEGHGREHDLVDGADLSRTVGWFTAYYPLVLTLSRDDPVGWLRSVKEQRRALPHGGVGYGVLRYYRRLPELTSHQRPQVALNHLGRLDAAASPPWGRASEVELRQEPDAERLHLLDVVTQVRHERLEMVWTYGSQLHDEATVRRLADEVLAGLRQLVVRCTAPGAGGRSPSDFPLADLDQATLDRVVGDGAIVEDLYPLTPMQSGMLVEGMVGGRRRPYLEQVRVRLDGIDQPALLDRAWQAVVRRNPVLRTAVRWRDVPEPLQVVQRTARLPVEHLDWRELDEDGLQRATADHLVRDREHGLDPTRAPMARVAIAQLAHDRVLVVWTFHHMLLDGWSASQVWSDLLAEYGALTGQPTVVRPPRRPFREFVGWLQVQDYAAAEERWRRVFTGFRGPTPLPLDRRAGPRHRPNSSERATARLSQKASGRVRAAAERARVTEATLVQGAWALFIAGSSGERDVCFGVTVSGRSADLPGVESTVGLLINALPVRVRIDGEAEVGAWLRELQADQAEARQHEHVPLVQVRAWAGADSVRALFDSLVVVENYPVERRAVERYGLRLLDVEAETGTNFPLTLAAYPADIVVLALYYDPDLVDPNTGQRLVDDVAALLEKLADGLDRPLGAVLPGDPAAADIPHGPPGPGPRDEGEARTATEEALLAIWQEVLHVERLGVNDDFFDLGGDSVVSLRLVARMGRAFGVEVGPSDLFGAPTVRSLAAVLEERIFEQVERETRDDRARG